MPQIDLLERLKGRGYHSSIATTFSVDGAFYDSAIQRRLAREECRSNILIADQGMLADALDSLPRSFLGAGRRYAVVPARATACFHPKILLRLGERRARLQVGSANATAAGWCRNAELVCDLSWEMGGGADAAAYARLIRKTYDYLASWLTGVPGQAIPAMLRGHWRDAPWLADVEASDAPVALSDGSLADVLLERGDGTSPGILERLKALLGGERTHRIILSSPFWDADAGALKDLQDSLGGPPVAVALPEQRPEFPTGADLSSRPVSFMALPHLVAKRVAHAKFILIEGQNADHIVVGSANISRAALGGSGGLAARNAEACVYRRLPQGSVLAYLGIDPTRTISKAKLKPLRPEPKSPSCGRILPGTVEIEGRKLTWWPPSHVPVESAMVLHGAGEAAVTPGGNGEGHAQLPQPFSTPLVVRFRLADGRETLPVIVHDPHQLWHNAPGGYGPASRLINRFELGLEDILDLAALADLLFEKAGARVGAARSHDKEEEARSVVYGSPDEFWRETVDPFGHGGVSNGQNYGHFRCDDPIVALCSRISMGCLTGAVPPRPQRGRATTDDEEDDRAGENEDDDDSGEAETPPEEEQNPDEEAPPAEFSSAGRLARRRQNLSRALRNFGAWLGQIAADPTRPVEDVPAKVAFVLRLLNEAARARHDTGDGALRALIPMVPDDRKAVDDVSKLALVILTQVWTGQQTAPALVQRFRPDSPKTRERVDVTAFARYSRWMALRCLVAREQAGPTQAGFVRIATVHVKNIVEVTLQLAPEDTKDEELFAELERSVGGDPATAPQLLGRMKALFTLLQPQAPASQQSSKLRQHSVRGAA